MSMSERRFKIQQGKVKFLEIRLKKSPMSCFKLEGRDGSGRDRSGRDGCGRDGSGREREESRQAGIKHGYAHLLF